MSNLFEDPSIIRAFFSISSLIVFWGLALIFPFRKSIDLKSSTRWLNNLTFTFGNGLLVALVIPFSLIEISITSGLYNWNLLSLDGFPFYIQIILSVILLDVVIYWQHRLTHKIPLLWRLHRLHHSDVEIDTTTAGRFHTLEIFFSFFVKAFFVIIFKIPMEAIVIFEILLNFSSLFNHSNFQLPAKIENLLRYLVITPDLHRIHHSVVIKEQNSNFGFSVSFWDHLFNSYRDTSQSNPKTMKIGLTNFRERKDQKFMALLLHPLRKD